MGTVMTGDAYAYDLHADTIHRRTCPGAITDTARPVTSQEAHMRLSIGSAPCPSAEPEAIP